MKAIGYTRVSTFDQAQEGVSLEAQKARIEAYCILNGMELVGVVVDGGVSGKSTDRVGLQAVLEAVEAGEAGAVVVCKLDRLSRRVVDTLALIEQIEKAGAAFHSIAEKVDTKSAIGRFFLTIVAAFAAMEREVIAERTSVALRHLMAQGKWIGAVPFGFKVTEGRLEPVKEETDVLALVVTLHDQGYTLQAIADELILRGIPTRRGGLWRRCTVRDLLTRAEREPVHAP